MTTFISLLRGINVSGHRMIRMEALKSAIVELGYRNIRTYMQSGNLVFESDLIDTMEIGDSIKQKILETFGFDVPVIILTETDLQRVISENPFLKDGTRDHAYLHITFLSEEPTREKAEILQDVELKNDAFALIGKALYLYCPDGYSNSRLTNGFLEVRLKVTATTRNWKTTNELWRLVSGK